MYAICDTHDIAGRNRNFAHCQSRNEPLVVIEPNGEFPTISWDYISMQGYRRGEYILIDRRLATHGNAIMDELYNVFSSVRPGRRTMSYDMCGGYGYLYNVPSVEAPHIAISIFRILVSYLRDDTSTDN